jgi:hypothetical protein
MQRPNAGAFPFRLGRVGRDACDGWPWVARYSPWVADLGNQSERIDLNRPTRSSWWDCGVAL